MGDVLLTGIALGVAINLGLRGVPRNVRVELATVGVLIASTLLLTGLIGVFIGVIILEPTFFTSSGSTELRSSSLLSRCSWKFPYDDESVVSLLDFRFFFVVDFDLPLPFRVTPPGVCDNFNISTGKYIYAVQSQIDGITNLFTKTRGKS